MGWWVIAPCEEISVRYSRWMLQTITPQEAQELISRNEVDVVDVREPNEWAGGRLPGSRLVPLGQLRQSPKQALPRDGIIFVCAAGVRSETAARLALQNGLTHVYNLRGGTRNWAKAGLPLVQG
jgi:rhodanese-related sulfurtransferase